MIHHRVYGVLEFKNFAFHVDRNFLREIAAGDSCRHIRNITNLTGDVAGHRIYIVGQIFPRSGYSFHIRLAAQFSFRTYLASYARYFRCE